MNKKITGVGIAFFLISTINFGAQENQKSLALEDCIILALKNNLNIAVEVLNPEIADMSASLAKEKFLPSLSLNYGTEETNNPSYSWIESAGQVTSMFDNYSVQLEQLFPTGGTLSAYIYSYKSDTTAKYMTINPRYGSTLSFTLTQPLLKDFGFKVNRKEIIVANRSTQISEANFKASLIQTIYNVEAAYWEYVYSIENLKAKKQSLALARDLLAKNKREVEVGMMAPIEVLSAESEVAAREADIIEAEYLVKNNEDALKTIINLAANGDVMETKIIPSDTPTYKKRDIELDEDDVEDKRYEGTVVDFIQNSLPYIKNFGSVNTLKDATAMKIPLDDGSIDGVITSPPYSFAIDYVENDKAQLGYLGCDVDDLRSGMIGLRGRKKSERLKNYFEDMESVFKEEKELGRFVQVVYRNLIKPFLEAKDFGGLHNAFQKMYLLLNKDVLSDLNYRYDAIVLDYFLTTVVSRLDSLKNQKDICVVRKPLF